MCNIYTIWRYTINIPIFGKILVLSAVSKECGTLFLSGRYVQILMKYGPATLVLWWDNNNSNNLFQLGSSDVNVRIVMGPGQKNLTWVRSGQNFVARVGFGKFSIFSLRVKKMSLGWVKKYPGQSRVGLLFTAGQKYVWVWSGPISIARSHF